MITKERESHLQVVSGVIVISMIMNDDLTPEEFDKKTKEYIAKKGITDKEELERLDQIIKQDIMNAKYGQNKNMTTFAEEKEHVKIVLSSELEGNTSGKEELLITELDPNGNIITSFILEEAEVAKLKEILNSESE